MIQAAVSRTQRKGAGLGRLSSVTAIERGGTLVVPVAIRAARARACLGLRDQAGQDFLHAVDTARADVSAFQNRTSFSIIAAWNLRRQGTQGGKAAVKNRHLRRARAGSCPADTPVCAGGPLPSKVGRDSPNLPS